MRINGKMIRYK